MRGPDVTEATLERARAGDEEAFRALTEPHRRELQRALLPDPGLGAGRRGPRRRRRCWPPGAGWRASRAAPRCARGCTGSPRTAASTRCATTPAGLTCVTRRRPGRRAGAHALGRADLAAALPRRAARGPARPRRRPRRPLRDAGGRRRWPSSPGCSACRPGSARVLVLRDVLGYRAAEVAEMLGTERGRRHQRAAAGAGGARRRARAVRRRHVAGARAAERDVLTRFADAFERGDVDAVVALLTDDAWIRMPPEPHEYQGRAGHRGVPAQPVDLDRRAGASASCPRGPTASRRSPTTSATRRPASRTPAASSCSPSTATRSATITRFGDTGVLPWFGLPRTIAG